MDIDQLYELDLQSQTSIVAEHFKLTDDFDEACTLLSQFLSQLSIIDKKKILHYELKIPFNKHLLCVCYQKYGIDETNKLLEKYYDGNKDFYIAEISPGETITHLEHYKKHADTMKIVFDLRNKK